MTIRPIPLRIGRNQKSLSYKSDPSERATEIAAKCAQLAGKNTFLGNARFQVSASNSGAKTFVAVDPTGAKGPVGFDSQLVGFSILREKTNTLATITATVTVSQLVTLATWPSGMADGEYVQLRDADGLIPYVLQHPVYAAATYPGIGPKAGTIDRSDVVAVSNLLPNAVMRTWSDHAKMPDGWTVATLGSSPTFASASDTPPSGVTITRTTDPLYTQVGGASLGFSMNQAVFISPPIAWTPQYTGQRFSVLISMLLTTWAAIPSAFLRVQWGVRLSDGTVLPWFDPDLMQQVEPTKTRPAPWKQIAGGVWVELELPGFDITAPSTYPINLRPNASDLAGIATADGYVLILTLSANGGTAVVEGFLDGMIVTASDDVVDALSEFGDANGVYQDVENALGKIAGPQYSFSADVLDLKRLIPDLDEDELDRGNFVAVDSPDLGIVNDVQRITDVRINDLVEGDTTITIEPRLKRFTRRLLAGAKKTSDRITSVATTTGTKGTKGTTGGSPSTPALSLTVAITSDVPLTTASLSAGVTSVKLVVTTTPYATTADALTGVRAATAITSFPISYSGLDGAGSAATPGDTVYAYALAYDNNGDESALGTAQILDPAALTGCALSSFALADTPYVQGDDYDGGNPPFPAYTNTADFATWYWDQTPLRDAYAVTYPNENDGVWFSLDTSTTFNGHPTLKSTYGTSPAPAHHSEYTGAAWDVVPSDDGDPTETVYGTPLFGPEAMWLRVRFKADSGLVAPPTPFVDSDITDGLVVYDVVGPNLEIMFNIRNGSLFLDYFFRATAGAGGFVNQGYVNLGAEGTWVGAADFGELVVLIDGDSTAHATVVKVWRGAACSLTGHSPSYSNSFTSYNGAGGNATRGLAIDTISCFKCFFATNGPNRNLWVADWEMMPTSVDSNPFGVSLT